MKHLLVIVSVFLYILPTYSQIIIKGELKNAVGETVEFANVIAKSTSSQAILSFFITEEDGRFSLKLPSGLDSVILEVSHLSYEKYATTIAANVSKELSFVLKSDTYKLPELTVRVEKMVRRGDTLSYDVAQYMREGDQNIEKIISRIPGVEITSGGMILYNGLPINKFYVEGLDMMEGRYQQITKNLNPKAIRDIEILERHQAIRALDSIYRPNNAAINLRLKSSISFIGSVNAGLGLPTVQHDGQLHLFAFQKKRQMHLSTTSNNIGMNYSAGFTPLYESLLNFNPASLSLSQIFIPFIDNRIYQRNNEQTTGLQWLSKVGKFTQLKFLVDGTSDKINLLGKQVQSFTNGTNGLQITDEINNITATKSISPNLIIEHNAPKFFVKANIDANYSPENGRGGNFLNNIAIDERLNQNTFTINNKIETIFSHNKKAIKINHTSQYHDLTSRLNLNPALLGSLFVGKDFEELQQQYEKSKWVTNTYSTFYKTTKYMQSSAKVGYKTEEYDLVTELSDLTIATLPSSLGLDFQNNFSFSEKVIYLQPNITFDKGKDRFTFYGQYGYSNIDANRSEGDTSSPRNIALINPKLEYLRKFSPTSNLTATYIYDAGYNNMNNYNQGYILTQNRSLSANQPRLNEMTENKIELMFSSLKIEQEINYYIAMDLRRSTQSLLNSLSFEQNGTIENKIDRMNIQSGYDIKAKINKSFKNITTNGNLSMSQDWRDISLNGQASQLKFSRYQMELKSSVTMGLKSSVGFKGTMQYQTTNFNQSNLTTQGELEYFQILPQNMTMKVDVTSYTVSAGGSKWTNTIANIECGRNFKSKKSRLNLVLTNLTNKQYFVSNFQDLFSNTIINTRIRDRQVLLVYDFKF